MNQDYQSLAREADAQDPFRSFRDLFFIPRFEGNDQCYFTGNSLGLQPKSVKDYIQQELDDWARFGVEGHFLASNPWFAYHEWFSSPLAAIVGAKQSEVVAMNQLTVNLHLLMASFYKPEGQRVNILCEGRAFPSDQYALESQVRFHGLQPENHIVEVFPRPGENCLRQEDIIQKIHELGPTLALVMIGGVNYVTGQLFNMKDITAAAHSVGALAGFDLAHAAGNVVMSLHSWDVDFACWCSYKYLNSGPGGVGGAFVHERHHHHTWPRLAGWWGHDKAQRFKMEKEFRPISSAESWQLSNAPILSMAAHKASLSIFNQTNMPDLRKKSEKLTGFMERVIVEVGAELAQQTGGQKTLNIITPSSPQERGCQLSVVAQGFGKELHKDLLEHGVVSDWREPNVIRFAPVPLYNSFKDISLFAEILQKLVLA